MNELEPGIYNAGGRGYIWETHSEARLIFLTRKKIANPPHAGASTSARSPNFFTKKFSDSESRFRFRIDLAKKY